ncbi:MAG: hypothetical protein C0501_12695 [Isosphaera sp.]|nr:hypothetical protein [Isosphaera sp.]
MTCRYNGWKNYETWAVSLWLDNDAGTSEYWRDAAREVLAGAEPTSQFTRIEEARFSLAERLKDELEEGIPCPDAGLYTDLLNAALGEVDWDEIAASYLEEITEDEVLDAVE